MEPSKFGRHQLLDLLTRAARGVTHRREPVATPNSTDARPSHGAPAEPPSGKEQAAQSHSKLSRYKPILVTAAIIAVVVAIGAMAPVLRHARLQTTLPYADLRYVGGIAVDNQGTVYVANRDTVSELKALSNGTALPITGRTFNQSALALPGLKFVDGVAVGNDRSVYVTDWTRGRVLQFSEGSSMPIQLPFSGLRFPDGIAVDNSGTVYVADYGSKRVVALPKGQQNQLPPLNFNVLFPRDIAVDDYGTVYVTDTREGQVVALEYGSTEQKRLNFTSLKQPRGVAVDSSGSVYVADTGNSRVLMLAQNSNTQIELPITGLDHPVGVAVDGSGNVYVTDSGNDRVVMLAAK